MKNKILSLLSAICLAACLLPIPTSATTVSASVSLSGNTLQVAEYDAPAYCVNTNREQTDTQGNKFTATTQATTTHSEKWNAKLVWHSGEDLPTLYLKDFIVDEYNEETASWAEFPTTAISIPAKQPTKIVITGGNSQIKSQFGILYKSDLQINSDGDAKLNIWNISGAITSGAATGCKLSVNANLDLFVQAHYDASSHILQTNKADLTINGGNIKISTDDEKSLFGIVTRHSGNIIINGGNLDVTSSIGAAPSNGSIHSSGKIIINSGAVKASAKFSVPLYAKKGIEIAGGLVDISSPYYGINAGTPEHPADIAINGGTVKITAKRAFFTHPVLGDGVFAYAGLDEASADIYDGSLTSMAKESWMLISNDPSLQRETDPTVPPTEAPTTAPTVVTTEAPTVAPTTIPTTAPTVAPTVVPTAPLTEALCEGIADHMKDILNNPRFFLLWIAAVGAVGLIGIIVTLIIFRQKK